MFAMYDGKLDLATLLIVMAISDILHNYDITPFVQQVEIPQNALTIPVFRGIINI